MNSCSVECVQMLSRPLSFWFYDKRLQEEKFLRACSDLMDSSEYKRACTRCTEDTRSDRSGHIWSLSKPNVATFCEQFELERVLYHNEEQPTPMTSQMKQEEATITKD